MTEELMRPEVLRRAIKMDGLDTAVALVQGALCITTGDVAGQFFSGVPDDHWQKLDAHGRAELLGDYIKTECLYAVDDEAAT